MNYANHTIETNKQFKDNFKNIGKLKEVYNEKYYIVIKQRLNGKTLKEIAEQLGLTKERIRQMEAKANEWIRKKGR